MQHKTKAIKYLRNRLLSLFLSTSFAFLGLGLVNAQSTSSDLGAKTAAIFNHKCSECHSSTLRRVKGDFGFIEDLAKVAETYVAGEPLEDSELWVYLTDEMEIMPPPKAKLGPLTTEELAIVRWWIQSGSPAPKEASAAIPPANTGSDDPDLMAPFHPALVHFPLAFSILACVFLFLRLKQPEVWLPPLRLLLGLAAISVVLAATSGWAAADAAYYSDETVFWHRWLGVAGGCCLILSAILIRRPLSQKLELSCRALIILAAILLALAGHEGGLLVFGADHFG